MNFFWKMKKTFFLIFSLIYLQSVSSNESQLIDYYGVFSPDADKNMIKMTEDLFFTQLSEMNISINDRRRLTGNAGLTSSDIDFSESENKAMSFYVEIKRKGDALSKWNCTIFLKNNSTQHIASFNREYDSYYKILMDSKTSLKGIFHDLVLSSETSENAAGEESPSGAVGSTGSSTGTGNSSGATNSSSGEGISRTPKTASFVPASTENISGTWSGEEHIDKIVILKGGRGFIILKNGASMNVSITQGKTDDGRTAFLVKQTSHSNASYFPEIPRSKALEAAVKAPPIEYTLVLTDSDTLSGTKATLLEKEGGEVASGNLNVSWKKSN